MMAQKLSICMGYSSAAISISHMILSIMLESRKLISRAKVVFKSRSKGGSSSSSQKLMNSLFLCLLFVASKSDLVGPFLHYTNLTSSRCV